MHTLDALLTIAEISIAMIGFAGLVFFQGAAIAMFLRALFAGAQADED